MGRMSAVDQHALVEIHRLLGRIQAAWAHGDADELAREFSGDAHFIAFDGARLDGPAQIAAFHRRPFETHLRGMKMRIDVTRITQLAKGVYLVAASGGAVRADGGRSDASGESRQTFVCQDFGDRWAVTAFQNTRFRPLNGPRAALLWSVCDFLWSRFAAGNPGPRQA